MRFVFNSSAETGFDMTVQIGGFASVFFIYFQHSVDQQKYAGSPVSFCIYSTIYLVSGGAVSSGPLVSGRDKHAGC